MSGDVHTYTEMYLLYYSMTFLRRKYIELLSMGVF